jgi:flavin-dependent dehydrogenase
VAVASAAKTDLFVIGGGPAGIAAAIAATQKGLSVTLADGAVPPVEKPCGEGLMPETQAALAELGLSLVPGEGYEFRGMRFVQRGAQVSADFLSGAGIGLRRTLLHEKLIARAEQCGVRMLWKTPVRGIEPGGVILSSGFHSARWIVGADGCGSRVRRWCGLDKPKRKTQRHALRRHYRTHPWSNYMEIYWGRGVQAYVTPVGPEEVCIVMIADSTEKVRFDDALENWPDLKLRLTDEALGSRERGIVSYMHSLRAVHKDHVALVGDASGGVDAITGEGLRLAFRQAAALAVALEQNNLQNYAEAHRKLARRPMMMGHILLTLSRGERFRARVVQEFAKNPKLFSQFMAIHSGDMAPAQLFYTGAALGWRLVTA